MSKDKDLKSLRKILERLNLNHLNFIEKDAIYKTQSDTSLHETDRTPIIVENLDSDVGRRESCQHRLWSTDLGGVAQTNREGRSSWKLTNYICASEIRGLSDPVSFVATAISAQPATMTYEVESVGEDIELTVYSWDVNGDPAPSTRYSWRLWAPGGGPIID